MEIVFKLKFTFDSNQMTETLKVCINEFKFKIAKTKIMQIVQLNCHMCNAYIFKDEDPSRPTLIIFK